MKTKFQTLLTLCLFATLTAQVHAQSAAGTKPEMLLLRYNSASSTPLKVPVVLNDTLGFIRWRGWTASGKYVSGAEIRAFVSEAPGFNVVPSNFAFKTGPGLPDRMVILNNGNIGVGTSAPNFGLDVQNDGRIRQNLRIGTNGKIALNDNGDKLIINQANNFTQDVRVESDLEITGALTVSDLNVLNDLGVGRDATIGRDLSVGRNGTIAQDFGIGRNLQVGQNAGVTGQFSAGNAAIATTLSVGTNATIGQNLTVNQNATIQGTVNANQNLAVANNLTVGNNSTLLGTLSVGSGATINGDLRVNSRVAIGTGSFSYLGNTQNYELMVDGGIAAREVRVAAPGAWPDYVFAPDYPLKTIAEVAQYIQENQHLPNVPSAQEVEKGGIDVAAMNKALLEKVEEMTLYLIQQHKEIEQLKVQVENLKK